MAKDLEPKNDQRIEIRLGQYFQPFQEVDIDEAYFDSISPSVDRFRIRDVGNIKVDAELKLINDTESPWNAVVDDAKGRKVIRKLPGNLYHLEVTMHRNLNSYEKGKEYMCVADVGGLQLISQDLNRGNDGFVYFGRWDAPLDQETDETLPVLISLSDIPDLRLSIIEKPED